MWMAENKEKIEVLTRRVDELIPILKDMLEDLREISASLKSLAVSQITQVPSSPVATPASPPLNLPHIPERSKAIEDIKMMFPEDLENLLGFEEKENEVIIKPRQFLGSDNFSKIASIVRGAGGEYISAGKASHFRVPKNKG
jgi:hypothetical protein